MNNNIGIDLNLQTRMARDKTSGLSRSFVQLSKDGKAADTSIGGLTGSLGGLRKAISLVGVYKLTQALGKAVSAAADIRESIHMYNVAMGEFAESTALAVDKLTELSGLDPIRVLDSVGEFNLLARSMGVTSENSSVLSENINRLSLDLASLTNRDILKVQEDFKSGLLGRSRTVYKYGIDITEAALAQEALNQGISKSVRHMTQAEKMQLRYQIMIRTTALAHGDFANTIETPANQMRILSDRILTATRSLGTIFIPMLTKVMPYLNAFAKMLNYVFQSIAKWVGYDAKLNEGIKNTGDIFGDATGDLQDGMEDAGKESKDTAKEIDKVKKKVQQLAGFDELNILGKHESPTTPKVPKADKIGGLGDYLGPLDFDLTGYDSNIDRIKQKSDEIFEKMLSWMKQVQLAAKPTTDALVKLWNEGLKELRTFTFQALLDFYEYFLLPVGKWTLGINGLPKLINILNDMLKKIKWNVLNEHLANIFKALAPLAINMGEGLLWFFENVLSPIGVWVGNKVAPLFLEGLTYILEILGKVIENSKPMWKILFDYFLKPLAAFTGGAITFVLWGIVKALEGLVVAMEKYPVITDIVTAFLAAWGMKKLWGVVGGLGGMVTVLGKIPFLSKPLALLGKAFKIFLPSGPVMIGIGAIIFALGLFNNKLSKESPEAVDIFAGDISDGTKAAVGSFLELEQSATNSLDELAWSGAKVSDEMLEELNKTYAKMTTDVVAELENRKTKSLKVMTDANNTQIKGEEFFSAETLKVVSNTYDEKIKTAEGRETEINKILSKYSGENIKLSDEDRVAINKIQEKMKEEGIGTLSASKKEQLIIMGNLKREGNKISTKGAADIVKSSLDRKNAVIREADEEYEDLMFIARELRKEGTKEAIEAANEIEREAKRQRKAAVDEAETMHNEVVKNAELQAGDQSKWIDFTTGEIKSGWKLMYEDTCYYADKIVEYIEAIPGKIKKAFKGSVIGNAIGGAFSIAQDIIFGIANDIIWVYNKVIGLFGGKQVSPLVMKKNASRTSGGGSRQTVSPYARGTDGHRGGHALVNDGHGPNYKELIRFPNGETIMPKGRNVMIPNMPKGTQVLSGDETKKITRYKKGTGGFWDSIRNAASGIWDWVNKPLSFVKKALAATIDFSKSSGLGLELGKGLVNRVTDPMSQWLSGLFGKNENPNAAASAVGVTSSAIPNVPTYGGVGFPKPPFRQSSSYGWRVHPIFGTRKLHSGVDLAAPSGTPVNAQIGGTVDHAGRMGGFGNMVRVAQGRSQQIYAHLSKILTSRGARVGAGQLIGRVGSTGNSTGPHLHYEKRINGVPVHPGNPLVNSRSTRKPGALNAMGSNKRYARGGFITGETSFGVAGEGGNEGIVPLEGRHMMPFADAIADRLAEYTKSAIRSNGNNNSQGSLVVKIGERTLVDMVASEINRKSKINGQTVIKV